MTINAVTDVQVLISMAFFNKTNNFFLKIFSNNLLVKRVHDFQKTVTSPFVLARFKKVMGLFDLYFEKFLKYRLKAKYFKHSPMDLIK